MCRAVFGPAAGTGVGVARAAGRRFLEETNCWEWETIQPVLAWEEGHKTMMMMTIN